MTAKEADIHLAPRLGTNVALLNAILNVIIREGLIDQSFLQEHTVDFEELRKLVADYPPETAAAISGVPPDQIEAAARTNTGIFQFIECCCARVMQFFRTLGKTPAASNPSFALGSQTEKPKARSVEPRILVDVEYRTRTRANGLGEDRVEPRKGAKAWREA